MIRWIVAAGGIVVSVLLALVLLVVSMTAASYPVMVHAVNQQVRVPAELLAPIRDAAANTGVPWPDLAAYLAVTLDYRLPIPSRPELVSGRSGLTSAARQAVEEVWMANAYAWLTSLIREHGGDFGPQVPASRRQEYEELREALRVWDQLYEQDRTEWERITAGETNTSSLALLEWPYEFPVPGGTFTDDWGFARPQNQGYAATTHQGTDIFAPAGTPVLAVSDGLILEAGWNYLGGWSVRVLDQVAGVTYYYAHLSRFGAGTAKGAYVEQGAALGYVGTSGEGPEGTVDVIGEPHLHFGIYLAGRVTNPYPYLTKWQARR